MNQKIIAEWLDWWFQVLISCDKCKKKAVEKGSRLKMPSSSVISLKNAKHSHKYTQTKHIDSFTKWLQIFSVIITKPTNNEGKKSLHIWVQENDAKFKDIS